MAKRHPNVDMENLAITEAAAGNPNFGPVIALCLLSKYLGLHKINGRKGEGHIVELPLERGFVLLFGRIWMFWRFVFRCFSLTGISKLLL
jgi:hypothetical protein